MRCAIPGILLLFASTPSAIARDEVDFARALARDRYLDLAEDVCTGIEKDSRSAPGDRAGLPFIRAEIRVAQAELEADPARSSALLQDAVGLLEKLVHDTGNAALADDARTSLGWIRRKQAQLIAEALGSESDPEKAAAMRQQALGSYQEVEQALRDRIQRLEAAPGTPENVGALIDSRLELGRTMLEHGKFPSIGAAEKSRLLTENIALLEEFEFDYGDRSVAFEAMCIAGLSYLELGRIDLAEGKLHHCVSLRERLAEDRIVPNDYPRDVIRGGVLALVRLLLQAGRPEDAVAVADEAFRTDPQLAGSEPGFVLTLEQAQARFAMRDLDGALALARRVIEQDPNGRWGSAARERMRVWIAAGRGTRIPPDDLLCAAEASMEREQWQEALAGLRRCIDACATDAERDAYAARAWYKIGRILLALDRIHEAAVAFETVCSAFPKCALAPKACFEAARCYADEFNASGDPNDEKRTNELLEALHAGWPGASAAFNVPCLRGRRFEAAKEFQRAAECYLEVDERAEAYEDSLVRAGYCLYTAAAASYSQSKKDEAARAAALAQMNQAERALAKFLARCQNDRLVPTDPELQRTRAGLAFIAARQLAQVYLHESVGRVADCLIVLDAAGKALAPEDERNARLWSLKIQSLLALDELERAIAVLEMMFERFPDGRAIAQASRSVAVRLHEVVMNRIDRKEDEEPIRSDLERLARYYSKWLDQGPSAGLRIRRKDLVAVADTLYFVAKRLNGLSETQASFLDLAGKAVVEPMCFRNAAFVHAMLVEGQAGNPADEDRINLLIRLARCHGFLASDPAGWDRAKHRYTEAVEACGLIDADGNLAPEALTRYPAILPVYLELGAVFLELGRTGSKFQFEHAIRVFTHLTKVARPYGECWWIARYLHILSLYLRGRGSDLDDARVTLENLERNNPDFDGNAYGIKDQLVELRKRIR